MTPFQAEDLRQPDLIQGQASLMTIFSQSLSIAAFLRTLCRRTELSPREAVLRRRCCCRCGEKGGEEREGGGELSFSDSIVRQERRVAVPG